MLKAPKITYLKDYLSPCYLVDTIDLYFDLREEETFVTTYLSLKRNTRFSENEPLILNGENLVLLELLQDGNPIPKDNYQINDEQLILFNLPAQFTLKIKTAIQPKENKALVGLYQSNGIYCTQCEAQGFRRITYFLDRPDVMAFYTVTIEADKNLYPILLSNGNLIESGEKENNRHYVVWKDPFKKPCYLFALVAGDLAYIEDQYFTQSARTISLQIYVEKGKDVFCQHAMNSLKRAMRWDEEKYGREYDLDIFMIVAVSDFNMGAMENKGLNIFNDKYILASPDTATDMDFYHIESVVAHEYFHNWTGNRITCRDWFQLSLKEGLTVFRDQEFSADMHSQVVQRINDVSALRMVQFPEDAGPLAHPVRPESYIEMNNFYTVTIYEKGAEIIRMIKTLLGRHTFRKGMDLYFAKYDGQAITCDDFIKAMEEVSGKDLTQFRLWYSQSGTPTLKIIENYSELLKTYTLSLMQSCPATPNQLIKKPMHIPLTLALFNSTGKTIPICREDNKVDEKVLSITHITETFTFEDIPEKPIASLLRHFSAPVKIERNCSDEELLFLLQHDTDLFNRWEASQQLSCRLMLSLISDYQQNKALILNKNYLTALQYLLKNKNVDKAWLAKVFLLPKEVYLGELMPRIDVEAIQAVQVFVKKEIAHHLRKELLTVYTENQMLAPYEFNAKDMAQRNLKNIALQYLMLTPQEDILTLCLKQFQHADNMTDEYASFQALIHHENPHRLMVIDSFYAKWQHYPLVIDKWLAAQATADLPDTLQRVKLLIQDPLFLYTNPNKLRAIIGSFSHQNFNQFHIQSGMGYRFLSEQIIKINEFNPQVAARLVEPLTRWKRYNEQRQQLMKTELERILSISHLSKDVYEIVKKSID